MFSLVWPGEVILKSSARGIPKDKIQLIHKAVLDACDKLHGVADGIINDPTQCHFNIKSLECKAEDTAGCLTPAQVETASELYAGPKNPRTGEQIFPGQEPGSELGWSNLALPEGPGAFTIGVNYFKYVLFGNPDWDYRTLNSDRDVDLSPVLAQRIKTRSSANGENESWECHGGRLHASSSWPPYGGWKAGYQSRKYRERWK